MRELCTLLMVALLAAPLGAETADDILMGSVVKSDKWKIDRVNDRETFDGNVSFRNAVYNMRADFAVYDRKLRLWDLKGSVYCLRKFADSSSIELRCGHGTYYEAMEKAHLYRGAESIRMVYRDASGKKLRGSCDTIYAQESTASMDLRGNFRLTTDNMDLFSDYGFYDNRERSFLIHGSSPAARGGEAGSKPLALGARDGRRFALTGVRIKYFKDTGDVKLYNDVAGWVDAGQEARKK